jgi:hypothetical protein
MYDRPSLDGCFWSIIANIVLPLALVAIFTFVVIELVALSEYFESIGIAGSVACCDIPIYSVVAICVIYYLYKKNRR